ncbi:MAG: oligosaccharide flippase family protein, partial [Flavobacteriaceae bacterium]|nr:oligosaccharide flippase family protein [Flavobacteriaceae bacterium]
MKFGNLFKNTIFYGLITILPRVLNLVLTPLHIDNFLKSEYGIYQGIFAYLILGNVFLAYGMETAFFRFANKESDFKRVESTALTSLFATTLGVLGIVWLLKLPISNAINYPTEFVSYAIFILGLDTLCVIPFAWLRNRGKSLVYALLKLLNISVNLGLNLFFFLALPYLLKENDFWQWAEAPNKIHYVFIANLVASLVTLIGFLPLILRIGFQFDFSLWRRMFRYAFPIFIAGIAFSINEAFDRIFIRMFSDAASADEMVGIYAACYKMGVFMTLFITAYKLGVEPFFFREASNQNAPRTYAKITEFFTISGASILLIVSVYVDVFKRILIPNH